LQNSKSFGDPAQVELIGQLNRIHIIGDIFAYGYNPDSQILRLIYGENRDFRAYDHKNITQEVFDKFKSNPSDEVDNNFYKAEPVLDFDYREFFRR